jgi:putative membrane protein
MMDFALLGKHLVNTLVFTVLGLVLFGLAFWLMELLTPFSIRKELEEDQNVAVAIVMGSVVIGISLVLLGALLG